MPTAPKKSPFRPGKLLLVALPIAVALILGAGLVLYAMRSTDTGSSAGGGQAFEPVKTAEVVAMLQGLPQTGKTLGEPDAPVTITEYGDLRCPACRQFAVEEFPTVVDELIRTGKAKYTFELWPILGPDSLRAAQAGIAAQQQDKFFEYASLWYENQRDESEEYADADFTNSLAGALGIALPQFGQDREDENLWGPAVQDVQVATAQAGFQGTPSFIVEGPAGKKTLAAGVPTAADIAAAVDEVS